MNSCTVVMLTALLILHWIVITIATDLLHAKRCNVCFHTILMPFLSLYPLVRSQAALFLSRHFLQ